MMSVTIDCHDKPAETEYRHDNIPSFHDSNSSLYGCLELSAPVHIFYLWPLANATLLQK